MAQQTKINPPSHKYEELLMVGFIRRYDIPLAVINLCHIYFGSFIFPSMNSKVLIKSTKHILRVFELIHRDDYRLSMKQHIDQIGAVLQHHITNGVQIQFEDEMIWFEPSCFSQISGECIKINQRYIIDDKVLLLTSSNKSLHINTVGTICKYNASFVDTPKLSVCFGDHHTVSVPPEHVQLASSFFGHFSIQNTRKPLKEILSLQAFSLREAVKVKDDFNEVQSGFEIANRSDCYQWMQKYCGKIGNILRFHATNGICLQMHHIGAMIWFEPPCVEKVMLEDVDDDDNDRWLALHPDTDINDFHFKYHHTNRLLPGTKVKLNLDGHKHNGRVGKIGLHFQQDFHQVTVKFSDDEIQVLPESLQIVTQYYNV